jgi:hypothetical protein
MSEPSIDGEALSDPGFHEDEGPDPTALGPRDFLVAQADGSVDHHYRVGRLALPESGILVSAVAVAEIEGRLLVAVLEAV